MLWGMCHMLALRHVVVPLPCHVLLFLKKKKKKKKRVVTKQMMNDDNKPKLQGLVDLIPRIIEVRIVIP